MCERARVLRDAHMRLHEIRIWGERGRGIKSAFTDALSRCEEGGELKRGNSREINFRREGYASTYFFGRI